MADAGGPLHSFGNVMLSGRGNMQGQLRLSPAGFNWRKAGGGKEVNVSKDDLAALTVTRIPGSFQLSLKQPSGDVVMLHGFREADVAALREHAAAFFPGVPLSTGEVAVSGKNWGEATVSGGQLVFSVANKPAFHVDCADISAVSQQGKTDVLLEFTVDDTHGAAEKDALFELSFHVPLTSVTHAAPPQPDDGDADAPAPVPAKTLADALLARASVGPTTGEPIALFSEVAVLIPRGRFTLEMHGATMRLVGQAADFKIQYTSILRLFVLPRIGASTTLAVLSLDPPIRRGATFYAHLVLQFAADEEVEMEPSVPPELADKYAGKLEARYSGAEADVFAKVLKALAGTKVTRAGSFKSPSGGSAVRCVHKADDGHLYPLEKAFFFLPKPPIFIRHDEVAEIEFERSGGGAAKTFDLKISLTSDTQYRFTNLARSEYDNLMEFLKAKQLPVASLAAPQRDAAAGLGLSDSEEEAGLGGALMGSQDDEGSEEDADFKAASGGSDSSGGEGGSGSDSEGGEGGSQPAEKKATPKKKRKDKSESAKEPAKAAKGEKGEKKKRAKKDPNAPKKGLSAFMFFSKARRAAVLAENPGIAFGEVGKKLGEAWKAATPEERAPFEAQAAEDKARWQREDKAYKAGGGGAAAPSGGGDAEMADPASGSDAEAADDEADE